MPTRLIRDGILTSERVNALSPLAELFYRRLMSVADDHGRFSGNLTLLRSSCYPLKPDGVKEDSIKKHLAECVGAGLIVPYTVAGKPYIVLLDFGQRVQSKSKYPDPPDFSPESTVVHGDSPGKTALVVVGVEDEVVGGSSPRKRGKQPKVQMPKDFGVSDRVRKWAAEKGYDRLQERLEHFKGKALANGYAYADWDEAFMGAIRDDWAKLPKASPSAVPRGKPVESTETPLEKAVNWIRQQCHLGLITETQRDTQIAEAKQKHGG